MTIQESSDIRIVRADDWLAIYIDGFCVWQHHSITLEDALKLVGVKFSKDYVNTEKLEHVGNLPVRYDDIPDSWKEV